MSVCRLLFWKDGVIRATHSHRWSPTCSPFTFGSNSGMLGAQAGPVPPQTGFPSLVSPRTQYNNMNLLGNVPSVSSLLSQSFGNGGSNPGLSGPGSGQRGGIDAGAESDPLSGVGNGLGFTPPASFVPTNMANPGSAGQGQQFQNPSGNQMLPDQQQSQQLEAQNFQHGQQPLQQFSAPLNTQQQQQYQSIRGGLGGVGPVKLEPQVTNDQHGQQQQLQSLRNIGPVKLEPQQIPTMRSLAPVKMEPQHSDQSLFLHQQQQQQQQHQQQQHQQQQQQFLHMSRQSSQATAAQISLLQQQRYMQLQQQQQQQLLKAIPQQRSQLQQQQFQAQNLPLRSPVKPGYEPGMCARRLTYYMYQQQHKPTVRITFIKKNILSAYCMRLL